MSVLLAASGGQLAPQLGISSADHSVRENPRKSLDIYPQAGYKRVINLERKVGELRWEGLNTCCP
jgi:hypothetical protein